MLFFFGFVYPFCSLTTLPFPPTIYWVCRDVETTEFCVVTTPTDLAFLESSRLLASLSAEVRKCFPVWSILPNFNPPRPAYLTTWIYLYKQLGHACSPHHCKSSEYVHYIFSHLISKMDV